MKEVAIVLLLAVVLTGCSNTSTTVPVSSGSVWATEMVGGSGTSSGFSFNLQFTLSGTNMNISNFELINSDTCFGANTVTAAGTLDITANSDNQVSGTMSFTLSSAAGDVVTLASSSVTGTGSTASNGAPLTGGVIKGMWTLVPASGSGCVTAAGSFTMTEGK
jgi:PBP1b-binding outer membrane lipoprotein LpoB